MIDNDVCIFFTNVPSFYKVKLYNEINKYQKILVVFIDTIDDTRNDDFVREKINFEFLEIKGNKFNRLKKILSLAKKYKKNRWVINGWDYYDYWIALFCNKKKNNELVVESSVSESSVTGLKGFLKRRFLSRVSKVYVPGLQNKKLITFLGFSGEIVLTGGVGLYNRISPPLYEKKTNIKRFIFVGRFIKEKNLPFIVNYFNNHPEYDLTLVGYGELDTELRMSAGSNIYFTGAVDNLELSQLYQSHDVFILPSLSETWGLVVEESLNNGLPVLVSQNVGCIESVVIDSMNGYIFSLTEDSFDTCVKKIVQVDQYNRLRKYICETDFEAIEKSQIKAYVGVYE